MAATLQVELVTPEKLLFSDQAEMVEAPGVEGDFGVLPQHAPFVSLLKPGLVTIHQGGAKKQIFVTSGLAQVDGEKCVILAEQVHDTEKMTQAQAQEMLKNANRHLAACKPDSGEYASAQKDVAALEALCGVVKN